MMTDNHNQRMLFNGKRTGVDVKREPAQRDSPAGELFPCSADREDEKLSDDITD